MSRSLFLLLTLLSLAPATGAPGAEGDAGRRILLVAGATARVDKPGHHDCLAGCRLLADLLEQTSGVQTVLDRVAAEALKAYLTPRSPPAPKGRQPAPAPAQKNPSRKPQPGASRS